MECIAERSFKGVNTEGEPIDICIGVGVPYLAPGGEWSCPVKIDGILRSPTRILGVDSWQALQLAQRFISNMLTSFIEKGGSLFLFDKQLSIEELLDRF